MARLPYVVHEADDPRTWSEWVQPRRSGYKMACCDCGLVHDMQFRLVPSINGGRHIHFRVRRNERSTAAVRREDRRRQNQPET
jgi:hypothetical protein